MNNNKKHTAERRTHNWRQLWTEHESRKKFHLRNLVQKTLAILYGGWVNKAIWKYYCNRCRRHCGRHHGCVIVNTQLFFHYCCTVSAIIFYFFSPHSTHTTHSSLSSSRVTGGGGGGGGNSGPCLSLQRIFTSAWIQQIHEVVLIWKQNNRNAVRTHKHSAQAHTHTVKFRKLFLLLLQHHRLTLLRFFIITLFLLLLFVFRSCVRWKRNMSTYNKKNYRYFFQI